MLSRRKLIWLPIFLAVLGWSVYTYATATVTYRSESKVLLRRGERESSLNARVRVMSWEEEVASEVQTVFSDPVRLRADSLLAAEGVLDAHGEPLTINFGKVSARPVEGSNVMLVLFQNRDPDLAQRGVTALTRAYIDYRNDVHETPNISAFFDGEIAHVRDRLADLAEQRQGILEEAGWASIGEQRAETGKLLGSIRATLVHAREERAMEESRLRALRRFRETGSDDVAFIPVLGAEEGTGLEVRRILESLIALRSRENELASRYTADHPQLSELREQLTAQETMLADASARYERSLEASLSTLRAREATLTGELDDILVELSRFPERESELTQVNLEIEALSENYRQLVTGAAAADIQNASAPSRAVTLFAAASSPLRVHTGDLIRTLVVPLFALVVALGLAFIIDGLDPSVKTTREAEDIFGAPVLASVARTGKR